MIENSGQSLDYTKIIAIPYISEVSQKIKHILNKYDFKTVYKKGTSIRSMLTKFKHKFFIHVTPRDDSYGKYIL